MAEYFANGSLHYQDGEWRDDNGDVVEIEQVRHGEWIYVNPFEYHCAVCGRIELKEEPYCHCGAKMKNGR